MQRMRLNSLTTCSAISAISWNLSLDCTSSDSETTMRPDDDLRTAAWWHRPICSWDVMRASTSMNASKEVFKMLLLNKLHTTAAHMPCIAARKQRRRPTAYHAASLARENFRGFTQLESTLQSLLLLILNTTLKMVLAFKSNTSLLQGSHASDVAVRVLNSCN